MTTPDQSRCDTPLTDAIAPRGLYKDNTMPHWVIELAGHARDLERKLAKANAELAACKESIISGQKVLREDAEHNAARAEKAERDLAAEREHSAQLAELRRNEEHRQRLIAGLDATAAKMHPHYGSCDGFAEGACSECVRIVAELREDKARLDWVDEPDSVEETAHRLCLVGSRLWTDCRSLRAAIDAARAKKGQQ